ncbi:MAG: amidohydrolase, partial [Flavobacteriaceae bacterium]|nr:amidohydrolase [Flavobacteriaceae bacterium]
MKIDYINKLQCFIIITLQFFFINGQENLIQGPYEQLILRNVTLINGNGAPPIGPVDIEIKQNIITKVKTVGYPGVAKRNSLKLDKNGYELNLDGMYVLPGFVDMHGHIGGKSQGAEPDYVFKLWMAHGITTIREPSGRSLNFNLDLKKKSENNSIIAPRIFTYTGFGIGSEINTVEDAVNWVRDNAIKGADGIKFFGSTPEILNAAIKENKRLGLRSAFHHSQMSVARWNVLNSARAGLTTMEHWYGLPEALFNDKTIQNYPPSYNYQNEQHRFEEAGKLWSQSSEPF